LPLRKSEILPAMMASVRRGLAPMSDDDARLLVALAFDIQLTAEQLRRCDYLISRKAKEEG